ncbi:MAG: hypothetical protein ACOZCL_07600 [Bacillota bacterium]
MLKKEKEESAKLKLQDDEIDIWILELTEQLKRKVFKEKDGRNT